MSKELMLFCNADGKWAVYDDTFDITIHCGSQKEQDKAMAMLRKANSSAATTAMVSAVLAFLTVGTFEEGPI